MDKEIANWLVYACVFLTLVLPVVLWKRDTAEDVRGREAGWANLPSAFRVFWSMITLLEYSIGLPLARMMSGTRHKYERWILASALPLTPARVFTLQALSLVGGGCIGALLFIVPGLKPLWSVLAVFGLALIGWIYPSVVLEKYVEWRKTEITRTLPFAIDLIGSAMRAGLEFGAAMRYFESLRMEGPLTEEFGTVLQQIELGKTRTEALAEMARRVQVEAFTSFAGVVAYGSEIGASISETLRIHGEELRRARFHLAERKAARAPSLMILPMAVFIMPAVFIIIITPVIMKMKGTGIGGH